MTVDDVQAKIVVLYPFTKFRPAFKLAELQDIVVETGILDFFTFMHYFYDLLEHGYINEVTIGSEKKYDIATKGTEAVEFFCNVLPTEIKVKLRNAVDGVASGYEKGSDVRALVEPAEKGYVMKCGIYEWNQPMMRFEIAVGDKKTAQTMADYFKANPTEVYKGMFQLFKMPLGE
ncbi:MAG: DUF4364 family protein [Eubacteriales bacterium]|nr:DUF4364 family protein [Eubacteriales bacterium]